MESRIASQLADKLEMYFTKKGNWDFHKSEQRRKQLQLLINSKRKPLPITKFELLYLKRAASTKAIDKLVAAIFSTRNRGH